MKRLGSCPGWVSLVLGLLLAGCVTMPSARKDLLDFLRPGQTTREEVILHLGQPSGSFEQERILTYRLGEIREEGYFIIAPRAACVQSGAYHVESFSLVIVFDGEGRLQKHQLVRVR